VAWARSQDRGKCVRAVVPASRAGHGGAGAAIAAAPGGDTLGPAAHGEQRQQQQQQLCLPSPPQRTTELRRWAWRASC
jgi:hypothetical protein